ncbi:uncharacterized protein VTP21DRAFT_9061 [Calcarisporiella thermophila]|uniref:uncharacterized protein n=1 Tax=Calcarisporiella thermophila TaxID=911321 RepID=UPI003743024F
MVGIIPTPDIQLGLESIKYQNADQKAHKICEILARYRISGPVDLFEQVGRPKIHAKVRNMILNSQPVEMILPAYPFKSPNSTYKVIGVHPDKAEEFSLIHLNGLCQSITEVYPGGAKVVIASDGLVYNDLLSVSDQVTWRYDLGIRDIVRKLDLKHIEFVRACELIGEPVPQSEEQYIERIGHVKARLFNEYLPEDYDLEKNIQEDPNALATYRGYLRFLALDLKGVLAGNMAKSAQKKAIKVIAKEMIRRGKCFAKLIAINFASSVRLSIHAADNTDKLAITLFPGQHFVKNPVTPWHNTPYQDGNATFAVLHRENISESNVKTQIVLKEDKPWIVRENNDTYDWERMDLNFELMYPCGIMISPVNKNQVYNLVDVDMKKVRHLALSNSPVIFRGFSMPADDEIFRKKAVELGDVQIRSFEDILEVEENADSIITTTRETVPFNFDGCFKMSKNEKGKIVSQPPLFQIFHSNFNAAVGGLTLFSSSKLFLKMLPEGISLEMLSKLEWTSSGSANGDFIDTHHKLPLIVPHPVTGAPVSRFHEPWLQSKTSGKPIDISIVGVNKEKSKDICEKLTALFYDRRVCYRHQWESGDILISDTMSVHHARAVY